MENNWVNKLYNKKIEPYKASQIIERAYKLYNVNKIMNEHIISTGIDFLDKQLGGGLSKGINVISSSYGVGKTSFSMMLCKKLYENNYNILHLTSENNPDNIINKYLQNTRFNLNNNLYVKTITIKPRLKKIIDLINEISYDVLLLDIIQLKIDEFYKLIEILKQLNKVIIITTHLYKDINNKIHINSIIKYLANNILILEHQDKKNNLLKINISKTRYGYTNNLIKNVYLNYQNLECQKLNKFKLFYIKIINFLIRCFF